MCKSTTLQAQQESVRKQDEAVMAYVKEARERRKQEKVTATDSLVARLIVIMNVLCLGSVGTRES